MMWNARRASWSVLFALALAVPSTAGPGQTNENLEDPSLFVAPGNLTGIWVFDASGARVGRIENVLLDSSSGDTAMVVLTLLPDERRVGVPWTYLSFGDDRVLLTATARQLEAALLDETPGYFPLAPYRRFNPETMVAVEGTIVGVVEAPLGEGEAMDEIAVVQTSAGSTMLSLAPDWYLDEKALHLTPDEQVKVKGSRMDTELGEVIAVTEIEVDGRTVKLRTPEGAPLWR